MELFHWCRSVLLLLLLPLTSTHSLATREEGEEEAVFDHHHSPTFPTKLSRSPTYLVPVISPFFYSLGVPAAAASAASPALPRPQGREDRPVGLEEEEEEGQGGGKNGGAPSAIWRHGDGGGDGGGGGACCYRVKVAFTRGHSNGAYKLHPYAFGLYTLEPGSVRGRPHYTSGDGRFALAFCGDSWWVQLASNRGECRGWLHSGWQVDRCVSDIDYTWRFYVPEIDTFVDADKGLSVWCKS